MYILTADLEKWISLLQDRDIPVQLDYYHTSRILTEEWKRKILN